MTLPLVLMTLVHVAIMGTQVATEPGHFSDPAWFSHAQYHLAYGLIVGFVLNIVALIVAYGPFKRGEMWAWWTLLLAGLGVSWGLPIAAMLTSGGELPAGTTTIWGVYGLIYLIGLGLAYKHMNKA